MFVVLGSWQLEMQAPTLGRENSILHDFRLLPSRDLVPSRDIVGIKGLASGEPQKASWSQ